MLHVRRAGYLASPLCFLLGLAQARAALARADEPPVLGGPRITLADLDTPRGVAIGPNGAMYVVESGAGRVRAFAPDGSVIASFGERGSGPGELLHPAGIARSADGKLWVADEGNHRLAVFDEEAGFVAQHGGLGSAPGRFHSPCGIAARDGIVAVADTRNARVQVLDGAGEVLRLLEETALGRLRRPVNVAFDPSGRLLVADADLHRVFVWAPGASVAELAWGDWGWFPGLFSEPWGLAVARERVFTCDRENHRVQVLDSRGAFLHKWGVHAILPREGAGKLHYPEFLAVREDALFALVSEPLDDRVQGIGPASEEDLLTARLREGAGQASPHFGFHIEVSEPWIAIDEPETHSVLLYDLRLGEPVQVSRIGGFGESMGFLRRPSGIVLDASGRRMWVCDAGNRRVHEIALRGSFDAEVGFDAEMAVFVRMLDLDALGRKLGDVELQWPIEPAGLERGPDGALYLLDASNERVHVFDASLRHVHSFGGHGDAPGRLAGPTDLCWSAREAALLVVDSDNRRVQSFSADRRLLAVWASEAFDRPWGIAVLPDGSAMLTDWGKHRLLHLSASGTLLAELGSRGIARGELEKPRGIAVGREGAVYVLDHANHRGVILDAGGNWSAAFGSRFYTQPARSTTEGTGESGDE